ncbi:uncharacterized protein LOC144752962 [Lissotriton helveticus]
MGNVRLSSAANPRKTTAGSTGPTTVGGSWPTTAIYTAIYTADKTGSIPPVNTGASTAANTGPIAAATSAATTTVDPAIREAPGASTEPVTARGLRHWEILLICLGTISGTALVLVLSFTVGFYLNAGRSSFYNIRN